MDIFECIHGVILFSNLCSKIHQAQEEHIEKVLCQD
jgi:hypothetical protein